MSKKIINIVSILFAIVLMVMVFALLLTTYAAVQRDDCEELDFLCSTLLMLTSSFGIYYILAGCKKGEGSKYYVWFMGALAACDLIALAASVTPIINVALALAIACNTVLCFSKDLGQAKSTAFAAGALITKAVVLVVVLIGGAKYVNTLASLVLSGMALFMVFAKYYDKHSRGSK